MSLVEGRPCRHENGDPVAEHLDARSSSGGRLSSDLKAPGARRSSEERKKCRIYARARLIPSAATANAGPRGPLFARVRPDERDRPRADRSSRRVSAPR